MHYAQTEQFQMHVLPRTRELILLKQELVELATLQRGKRNPAQKARRPCVIARIKTLEGQLKGADDLSGFSWSELFHLLVHAEGNAWSTAELDLMRLERQNFEGKGEKAVRHRLGLPIGASQDRCDLPNDEEVKYVGPNVDLIRIYQTGRSLYGRCVRGIIRSHKEEDFSQEVWEKLADGETSASKLYSSFPEPVRIKLQHDLAPEKGLATYSAIYVTTDVGFIRVARADYAAAWRLAAITQASPKYNLRRSYVLARLQSLASQNQPNVAA